MARALPTLDKGRKFASVLPPMEDGTAFKQFGYFFNTQGECIASALTDEQRERHSKAGDDDVELIGSDKFPTTIPITDTVTADLVDIVEKAAAAAQLDPKAWNALHPAKRDKLIQLAIDDIKRLLRPVSKSRFVGTQPEKPKAAPTPPPEEDDDELPPPPVRKTGPKPPPAEDEPTPRQVAKEGKPMVPEGHLDLSAWMKGDVVYKNQEVIAFVKEHHGNPCRTIGDVKTFLKEKLGMDEG